MKTCDESGHLLYGRSCFHEAARPDRPLLVGESNPYSFRPEDALLPWPEGASGDRLARILGLTDDEYLAVFDRIDLCGRRWDTRAARERACLILFHESERAQGRALVLLGRRVATAFDAARLRPFSTAAVPGAFLYVLPHPSGRCREWGNPGAMDRARLLLAAFLPVKSAASGQGEAE